jgi:hypothetical protein
MLTKIEKPDGLPTGIDMRMSLVADETEAAQLAGKADGYLFQSRTIKALYLFIPVVLSAALRPSGRQVPAPTESETK